MRQARSASSASLDAALATVRASMKACKLDNVAALVLLG